MAKKYFLSILALMFCFNAFSQTQISTAEQFLAISSNPSGNYIQTADIDLGDRGTLSSAIIPTFSGVYDGGGYTITYTAHFQGSEEGKYGLFGTVSGNGTTTGIIRNLNVNASATLSGNGAGMRCGLLCGYLYGGTTTSWVSTKDKDGGLIENCNVSGNVNSTANANFTGSASAGLIIGYCRGTLQYSSGSGNVTGAGYVGGLVGNMGIKKVLNEEGTGTIKGCSFIGEVTAKMGAGLEEWVGIGAMAGGICGYATSSSTITLCYVSADIKSDAISTGAGGAYDIKLGPYTGTGTTTVTNNYCQGTVDGDPIGAGDITNSAGNTSYNYYPGGSTQNGGTQMTTQQIVDALNTAAGNDMNIHFSNVSGDVVFGQQNTEKVCETPTNLQVQQVVVEGVEQSKATWNVGGESSLTESKWYWNLDGSENYTETTNLFVQGVVSPSPNPYTFYVKSYCSYKDGANTVEVYSDVASIEFFVDCPKPTGLTASNITDNGFTLNWTSSADCQVILGSTVVGEVTTDGSNKTYTFTGLNPETTYNVTIKAKCGEVYEEEASISVTTARLSAPTNLAVNTVWQSTSGKATITWVAISGITYEVNTAGNIKTTPYVETGLAVGNYTVKVRAKKGDKYSDWVSMPYTVSNPPAPKNPQVTYTQNGNAYDVTVTWTEGSATNDGWIVNGNNVNVKSYTLTSQAPGSESSLSIIEKTGQNTSAALIVPIQVPCLPATLPTNISTTQTTAIFTFANENSNRKIVIGSNEYDADDASVTISNLNTATNYNYSVLEYCTQTLYSEESGTFATVGCYQVSNLEISNVSTTTATVSWQSQSSLSGLQYQIVLKKGNDVVSTDVQTTTTKTFSGLTKATKYTVEVSEQCGNDNWTNSKIISFTTESGVYKTIDNGDFNSPEIWENGKVPTGGAGEIIINHMVTLSHKLTLSGSCRITNQGVLQITQQGELINTTSTNVGGIVEIETPQKDMDKWTFIGAPFENYKLETIKPVSGSDISVSLYDYDSTKWDYEWAHYNTAVGRGDGYFAWPFYGGAVTYTTYGDLFVWNAEGTSGTIMTSYDFSQSAKYQLNNAETFTVTKNVQEGNGERWMALSNPYPAKLSVSKFVNANNANIASVTEGSIQGQGIYRLTNTTETVNKKEVQTYTFVTTGDIAMTEGFFVNLASGSSVTFEKEQLTNYPTPQSKSQVSPREFIELSLVKGNHKSKLYFAHNQEAEQNYDIFDANKLFAIGEVAEPYFVTDGIALVKEEVKELPYYATMNVRSFANDTISFVVENIPEGISVFLIDNEEEIKMSENIAYTTLISEGENADRFQVLFKKASIIEEAKDSDITITNSNRLVNVASEQTDLRIEVYNALGQRVFATNDYNFILNQVSAGTYMIKAFNNKVSKTQKIVVE